MSSWNLTIPFVAGEDKKNGMYRIHNLMMESAKAQGFENQPVKPKRPASQIWQQLQSQGVEQRVKMELIKPGQRVNLARARRTFSPEFAETVVNYEFATGDDQLDEIFKRIAPELSDADIERMSDASSARKRAFDASIDGLVGVDSKIRNRQISTSDKFLKSYIIGHAPARAGKTLDEQRRRELQDLVKASLGNLGIMEDNMSRLLRHRIQSRPILMNERVETEFRAMIHAYHEVRRHNAPYLQAMMGGMDGAQDPEGLIAALIPSPDDIMRGAIAHMIIDLNAVPEGGTLVTGKLSGLLNFVRDTWRNILNLKRPAGAVSATTKQQSVARLLAMTGGRKKTVSAIENAVNKAQTRGADFIRAFKTMRPKQIDEESIRRMITPRDTPSNITISESNMTGVNSFFGGKETNIFSRTSKIAKEKGYTRYLQELMQAMEKQGLVYPIGGRLLGKLPPAPEGGDRLFMPRRGREEPTGELLPFVILPMELPSFTRFPTGWDRRWMVATMRVIDEYWDFIYSGEGILLSNLLYLIVSRAEELFQYRMDPTEITQLAILLSKDSSQAEVIEAVAGEEEEGEPQEEDEEVGGFEGGRQAEDENGDNDDDDDIDERYDAPEDDDPFDIARRRARRGGIMPTPRDKSSEMLYRPLKTLSRLVTNSGQAQLAKERVEKLAGKIERLERRDTRRKGQIDKKREEIDKLKAQLAEEKELKEDLEKQLALRAVIDPADEEILSPEEARDYTDKLLSSLNDIKNLDSYIRGKSRTTFEGDSPFVKQVDDAIDRVTRPTDTIRHPINEALWVQSITTDSDASESAVRDLIDKIEKVPLKAARRARSYPQSGQRTILARVYAEVSVPRSRNLKKNLQSAMLDLYAMMYDEAKGISGAKKLKNIEIGMVNIGEDIFQFYGEADVIGPSKKKKSNPPESHRLSNPPSDKQIRTKLKKILSKEGGAAGLEPLMEAFPEGTTKKQAKSFIADKIDAVYQHGDGDYILKEKASKERKYKGHIISKVSTGWMVDAYDESFKTLKQARDFISEKVSGTATANEQCVRMMPGAKRCVGTVVFMRSKRFKCDKCGAEYREA